jgi:hypothetical protein
MRQLMNPEEPSVHKSIREPRDNDNNKNNGMNHETREQHRRHEGHKFDGNHSFKAPLVNT